MDERITEYFHGNISYHEKEYDNVIDFDGNFLSIFASESDICNLASIISENLIKFHEESNINYTEIVSFVKNHIQDFKKELMETSNLDFYSFSDKWDKSQDNNFATDCFNIKNKKGLENLILSIGQPPEYELTKWRITYKEYFDGLIAAYNEHLELEKY